MRTFTKEELDKVLQLHAKYLKGETGGERADLSNANLFRADLSKADLSRANLSYANLSYAYLSKADLYKADLYKADLYKANLSKANLTYADLSRANLSYANLSKANLSYADLSNANLYNADLKRHQLSDSQLALFKIVPEVGGFYGYKKVSENTVILVYVSKYSKRLNSLGSRKCRAGKVKVIGVYVGEVLETNHRKVYDSCAHEKKLKYQVGKWVKSDAFCADVTKECAPGIHFFLTYQEAKDWE